MPRKKLKDITNLKVERFAAEGKCIAFQDDLVIFIEKSAPGDIVDARVKKKKKNYIEAYPVRFHEYSPLRVTPFCEHFDRCGGCKWQHIPYEEQLKFKQQQVIDQLQRIGKVALPEISAILGSESTRYYRNKLEFTFSSKRWLEPEEIASEVSIDRNALGFHMPGRFDKIIDIQHCYLQPEPSNPIRMTVRNFAMANNMPFFDLHTHEGQLRNLIIRTANTGEVMVILQIGYEDAAMERLCVHLTEEFPEITSLNIVVNNKGNETFHDLEVKNVHGKAFITETMEDLQFQIGPKSFYQTNSQQAYTLYKVVREFAGLSGNEVVYDLYTGTGTIANFIATKAKHVIGMEYVPEAIEDAKLNADLNNLSNTQFYAGDRKSVV